METVKELLLVTGRIATIFPLLLLIALYMGKRSIGELPVFDFLVILALGAVVGADIADPKIEHLHTAYAIVVIGLLQRAVSTLAIKWRTFGKWITFEPTVVVHQGHIIKRNLQKVRYSVDNVIQMIREKDVFNLDEVELAVLEANGKLTLYKKASKTAVTAEDLGVAKSYSGLAYPLIVDGNVLKEVLAYMKKDMQWLETQLKAKGASVKDIFFASINDQLELHISLHSHGPVPPMLH
ncbi:hypothetical protein PSTEL_10720 [Paenibacillus stellifer]|uniref:YetF C-terminal domain-containing protein n=1 Tax=Paenibacillus stellifer TaxID=169760 RepID=A0A089LTP3_9BACL|nr:DUF421 domain-containing protein [Paenibacillus stellifer]AIQ63480.1 hypothetical protein PSTEL_10720 [Paenibacillus stellifer]